MNITRHDKSMETMTHEQMLDKYIGPVGTSERDEFEANLQREAQEYFIGEAIKETRKRQGLTQEQLGERMGVKKSYVSKMESGRNIAYSTIMRAFKALGVTSASLDLGSYGRVPLW